MRTIKFRAWDITNKVMIEKPYLHLVDGESFYLAEKGVSPPRSDLEFELMQFTGLLDKKGKEIYEGDILHIETPDGVNLNYNEVVEYHEGAYYPVCEYPEKEKLLEIIGNVFENPELLQKG